MNKTDWDDIRLYITAVDGLNAMAKLVGEKPVVTLSKASQEKWESTIKNHDAFYELPINERIAISRKSVAEWRSGYVVAQRAVPMSREE